MVRNSTQPMAVSGDTAAMATPATQYQQTAGMRDSTVRALERARQLAHEADLRFKYRQMGTTKIGSKVVRGGTEHMDREALFEKERQELALQSGKQEKISKEMQVRGMAPGQQFKPSTQRALEKAKMLAEEGDRKHKERTTGHTIISWVR